jgi:hypothetical protein
MTLTGLCVAIGLGYAVLHAPQQELVLEGHIGAPLVNHMYSHCLMTTSKVPKLQICDMNRLAAFTVWE